MKTNLRYLCLGVVLVVSSAANANLLSNGDLDRTYQQEIIPGLFFPKPDQWVNDGSRSITGPYEDDMSSEPWAGPAPTPVTFNGFDVTTGTPNGMDWGVFFKPFSGNQIDGLATSHLYQDVGATEGLEYTLTGWAGGEANALMKDAVLALEFIDGGNNIIGGTSLSLMPTLLTPNGQAFNYKLYSVSAIAPTNTIAVRSRISMIDAQGNPAGGGQAFVVDDFELNVVPEPATMTILAVSALAMLRRKRTS